MSLNANPIATDLFTKAVTVNTAYQQRRSEYIVGIGYGDDIDAARRLILETVKSVEGVLENPAPEALTVDLADFEVGIRFTRSTGSSNEWFVAGPLNNASVRFCPLSLLCNVAGAVRTTFKRCCDPDGFSGAF